jgi:hypothetical protein
MIYRKEVPGFAKANVGFSTSPMDNTAFISCSGSTHPSFILFSLSARNAGLSIFVFQLLL